MAMQESRLGGCTAIGAAAYPAKTWVCVGLQSYLTGSQG